MQIGKFDGARRWVSRGVNKKNRFLNKKAVL